MNCSLNPTLSLLTGLQCALPFPHLLCLSQCVTGAPTASNHVLTPLSPSLHPSAIYTSIPLSLSLFLPPHPSPSPSSFSLFLSHNPSIPLSSSNSIPLSLHPPLSLSLPSSLSLFSFSLSLPFYTPVSFSPSSLPLLFRQIRLAEVEQASLRSEQLSDKSSSPALPDDLSLDEHSVYQLLMREGKVLTPICATNPHLHH